MSMRLHRRRGALLPLLWGLAMLGQSPLLPAVERPVLRIYNWEAYLDPQLAAEFGRRHGVTVQESHFGSDTERDRRLAASQGRGFDLVIVDTSQVAVYRDRGWLAPIGASRVPGLASMHAKWRGGSAEATATHAFPYAWGTVGIGYRADLLQAAPDSWLQLLKPDAALCGKVQVSGNARELVAAALRAGGDSVNSTDPAAYEQAERLLRAQKPCVASYRTTAFEADAPLVTGRASAAMVYGTDVVRLREPANAARQSLFTKTATPNLAGQALLVAKIRTDEAIYPRASDLAAAQRIQRATPAIQSKINQIFAKIVPQD